MALAIERRCHLSFIEVGAEDFCSDQPLPPPIDALKNKGLEVIVHSTALSLGGSALPSEGTIHRLNKLVRTAGASMLSDHLAFVRSALHDSGHLLPVERTWDMIEVIVENIKFVQQKLDVPLAVENIATLFEWPHAAMDEAEFVGQIVNHSGCLLLLDLSNLFANCLNHNFDPIEYLAKLPLDRLSYVHIAGGKFRDGLYHDTHCDPVHEEVLALLKHLVRITHVPRVMVEIDDNFPREQDLNDVLDRVHEAVTL